MEIEYDKSSLAIERKLKEIIKLAERIRRTSEPLPQ